MKRVVLGLVALIACLSIGVSSASAIGTAASCVLAGDAGPLTPPVQFTGGSGSFTFGGNVVCQVNASPVIGTISAHGTFNNSVCGTGTADGTASIPGFPDRTFHIQFIAGVGVVMVPDGQLVHTAGAVALLPTGPDTSGPNLGDPGSTKCVDSFTVVGAFSVD